MVINAMVKFKFIHRNDVFIFTEYIEDLCPYATFQLNKQTYSESSYSGNVYSGPYHSVRGSFVYHDNQKDSYRVRRGIQSNITIMRNKIFCQ